MDISQVVQLNKNTNGELYDMLTNTKKEFSNQLHVYSDMFEQVFTLTLTSKDEKIKRIIKLSYDDICTMISDIDLAKRWKLKPHEK